MSTKSRKRAGYNWKARAQQGGEKARARTGKQEVELDESLLASTYGPSPGLDTNVEVLPPKRAKLNAEGAEGEVKRKRLNAKQKKRLLKVVQVKEKKAKVNSNKSPLHVGGWGRAG